jgi:hypothetical protein
MGKALADNLGHGRCVIGNPFDVTSNPFDVASTMVSGIKTLFLEVDSIICAPETGFSIK